MTRMQLKCARLPITMAALATVLLGVPIRAHAENVEFTFTPYAGKTTWSKYVNIERKPIVGVSVGALFRGRAGLEATYGVVSSNTRLDTPPWASDANTGPSVDMKSRQYGIDVLYNLLPGEFTPYVAGGWRHFDFTSGSDATSLKNSYNGFDAAIGARYSFTDFLAVRGDVRDVMFRFDSPPTPTPPAESQTHSVFYNVGLQLTVGHQHPAPPSPPPSPVTIVVQSPPDTVMVQAPAPPPDTVMVQAPAPPPDTIVVQAPPQVIVSERETELLDTGKITARDIHFMTAKWDILPQSFAAVNEIGQILEQWPQLRIEIGGHCDARGSDAYNLDLSDKRARAVLDYLVEHFPRINREQYTAAGYGERQPVADNTTVEGMAMNRRVEFKVLNTEELSKERARRHMPVR
jgi:outer membrane protein OmpA-like peptidoglycan-associated protein